MTLMIPLDELQKIADDAEFAADWRSRFTQRRAEMQPNILRWLLLLRAYHPLEMADQWRAFTKGGTATHVSLNRLKSPVTYNKMRPIIEVVDSLLAGAQPRPFTIELDSLDAHSDFENLRAEFAEELLLDQLDQQNIPEHFSDTIISAAMFGIGWVYSYLNPDTKHLVSKAVPWPGDVVAGWTRSRYSNSEWSLDYCIMSERMSVDTLRGIYGKQVDNFTGGLPNDLALGPDGRPPLSLTHSQCDVLYVWYRTREEGSKDRTTGRYTPGKEKIGYTELAYDSQGTQDSAVLVRDDDTGYPDIPLKWLTRFKVPQLTPEWAAGLLDDIVLAQTDLNEKINRWIKAVEDQTTSKFTLNGAKPNQVVKWLGGVKNVIPLDKEQKFEQIKEVIALEGLETLVNHTEDFILSNAGLSKMFLGANPPAGTSEDALSAMRNASMTRFASFRRSIQGTWGSMIGDIWIPLLRDLAEHDVRDNLTGKTKTVRYDKIFGGFKKVKFIWPDAERGASQARIQETSALLQAKLITHENAIQRIGSDHPLRDLEQIRKDMSDPILNPTNVREQLTLKQMQAEAAAPPQAPTQTRVILSGKLTPEQEAEAAKEHGIGDGSMSPEPNPNARPDGTNPNQAKTPAGSPAAKVDSFAKQGASIDMAKMKAAAAATPPLTPGDNQRPSPLAPGGVPNAAQGLAGSPLTAVPGQTPLPGPGGRR